MTRAKRWTVHLVLEDRPYVSEMFCSANSIKQELKDASKQFMIGLTIKSIPLVKEHKKPIRRRVLKERIDNE